MSNANILAGLLGRQPHPAEELASKLHNPEHAQKAGSVWQVWEDGEVTLQKCGDLLWQRTLHTIQWAPRYYVAGLKLPATHGEHSYAFVAEEAEAMASRDLIEAKVPR